MNKFQRVVFELSHKASLTTTTKISFYGSDMKKNKAFDPLRVAASEKKNQTTATK